MTVDSWDFQDFYSILASKNLHLIFAVKDNIAPPESYAFVLIKEIERFNPKNLTQTAFYDASHSYSDHRIRLTQDLLKWLSE